MQIRRTVSRALATVATLGLFAVSGSVQADGNYFLRFEGPNIDGESTRKGHEKWIEMDSFSWGVSVPYSGGGPGAGAGKPVFQDFAWTQYGNSSVASLFNAQWSGKPFGKVTVDFTTSGNDREDIVYFQMLFERAAITSLSLGGSGGSAPTLQGSFAYGTIAMKYWAIDPKTGKLGAAKEARYDLDFDKDSPAKMAAMFALGSAGPQYEVTPVPEPETYGMLLAGLGLMGVITRRRSRAKSA